MNSTMMEPCDRMTQSTIADPPKENTRPVVLPRHFGSAIESPESLDALIPIVYGGLRPIAHAQLSRDRGSTLAYRRRTTLRERTTRPKKGEEKRRPALRDIAKRGDEFGGKWAREELNLRPHAYQACALTT